MFDLVLKNGISHFLRSFLIDKLGGVAPHEHNSVLAGKLLFQELQIWQHMQAIDAAVGPEVNQGQFASQVALNRYRCRVEPNMVIGELLSSHLINLFLW